MGRVQVDELSVCDIGEEISLVEKYYKILRWTDKSFVYGLASYE